MRPVKVRMLAVLAGTAFAVAGCGGDDDDSEAAAPSSSSTAAPRPTTTAPSTSADDAEVTVDGVGAFESPVGGQFTVYARVNGGNEKPRTVYLEFTAKNALGEPIGTDNLAVKVKAGDPQLAFGTVYGAESDTLGETTARITANTAQISGVAPTVGVMRVTADYVVRGIQGVITGTVSSTYTGIISEAQIVTLCKDPAGETVVAGSTYVRSISPGDEVPFTITGPNQRDFPVTVESCEATASSTFD